MNCIKNGIKKEGESCSLNNNCIYPKCMKPTKQIIYIPCKVEETDRDVIVRDTNDFDVAVKQVERFVFTAEELNELLSSVIQDSLKVVTERLYETFHTVCEDGSTKGVFKTQKEALDFANILNSKTNFYHDWIKVVRLNGGMDKQSITNQYYNIFEEWKIKT